MENKTTKKLLEEASSCIKVLEVCIEGEENLIDNDGDIDSIDRAFTNECDDLEGVGHNTLKLREKYSDLRSKYGNIFASNGN